MKGNRHQRYDNHSGSADYQHAPEEKDADLLVVFITFFFFKKKPWKKKTSTTRLEAWFRIKQKPNTNKKKI